MGLKSKAIIIAMKLFRAGLGAIAASLLGGAAIGSVFEAMPWGLAPLGYAVSILLGFNMLVLELIIQLLEKRG